MPENKKKPDLSNLCANYIHICMIPDQISLVHLSSFTKDTSDTRNAHFPKAPSLSKTLNVPVLFGHHW